MRMHQQSIERALLLSAILPALPAQATKVEGSKPPAEVRECSLAALMLRIGESETEAYGSAVCQPDTPGCTCFVARWNLDLAHMNGPTQEWYLENVRLLVREVSGTFRGARYDATSGDPKEPGLHWHLIPDGGVMRRHPGYRTPTVLFGPCIHHLSELRSPPDAFVFEGNVRDGQHKDEYSVACESAHDRGIFKAFVHEELPRLIQNSWPSDKRVRWLERALYREGFEGGSLLERTSSPTLNLYPIPTRHELLQSLAKLENGLDQETLPMLQSFLEQLQPDTPRGLLQKIEAQKRLPEIAQAIKEKGSLRWQDSPIAINGEKFLAWCVYLKTSQPLQSTFGRAPELTECERLFLEGRGARNPSPGSGPTADR